MRVVFDANVLLGALARGGTCDEALWLAISRHRIITSAPILADVREKLVEKFRFSAESAEAMETLVPRIARVVRPLDVSLSACQRPRRRRHPWHGVEGSSRLHRDRRRRPARAHGVRGISIVTPRAFLALGAGRLEEE